jgi:head-tail adaptor
MITDYYDQNVLLQSPVYTQDSYGQNIAAWSTGVTVTCAIQGRSGSYPVINGVQWEGETYRLYCSSTVAITLRDRILQNGNYYYVTYINNNLRNSNHLQVDMELGRADRS